MLLIVLYVLLFAFGLTVLVCGKTLEERHHCACAARCEVIICTAVCVCFFIDVTENHFIAFFKVLIADSHFFKVVVYLRNTELFCADKAKSLVTLVVALYCRDKNYRLSFFTS